MDQTFFFFCYAHKIMERLESPLHANSYASYTTFVYMIELPTPVIQHTKLRINIVLRLSLN